MVLFSNCGSLGEMWYGCKNLMVRVNLFQLVKFVLLFIMDRLFSWFVYCFICLNWIVCNFFRIIQIVTCVKSFLLGILALGCVTVRFYY